MSLNRVYRNNNFTKNKLDEKIGGIISPSSDISSKTHFYLTILKSLI